MNEFLKFLDNLEKEMSMTKTSNNKKITEKEAAEMLKAKLICMQLDDKACFGKGCNRDCDNCKYMYGQGTRGEFEQALSLAIPLLTEAVNTDITALSKSYEDGLNDMLEVVKKIALLGESEVNDNKTAYSCEELEAIFNIVPEDIGSGAMDITQYILTHFSSKEIIEKVKAYEDKKLQLKVGEVVKQTFTDKEYLIIAESGNEDFPFDVIDLDTFAVDSIANEPKAFAKTGKTLDIKAILSSLKQ